MSRLPIILILFFCGLLTVLSGSNGSAQPPPPPGAGPSNDDCTNPEDVNFPFMAFDNRFATTDGLPLDLSGCDMGPFGDEQIYNDVWFRYTAVADGPIRVSTCDSANFDTRIAVYEDFGCPADPLVVVACNDDGPGCPGFTSELIFDAISGTTYLIRIGSSLPDISGTGELQILTTTTDVEFRRGDLNLDGACDLSDVIALLDYLFLGSPIFCADAGDINDDGEVDLADAIFKLTYLFLNGPAPADPGPNVCGPDPTDDSIRCEVPCP